MELILSLEELKLMLQLSKVNIQLNLCLVLVLRFFKLIRVAIRNCLYASTLCIMFKPISLM